MHIEISLDPSCITEQQLAFIYASVGFGAESDYVGRPALIARLFGPGVFGCFALHEGEPVGLLRAFSDGCMVAWIAEICVIPSHQRMGIGRLLMQAADAQFGGLALYADAFTHNEGFFNACGLRSRAILTACARAPLRQQAAA